MDCSYCAERLPCGVCKQTGDICPLNRTNLGFNWPISVVSTGTTPRTDKGPSDYITYITTATTEVTNDG